MRELVYKEVMKIPVGKVTTYGEIAKKLGINPRVVGIYLHQNLYPSRIPCHRVVNREGKIAVNYAFGGAKAQKMKLIEEGISFKNDKVNLQNHLWK